MTRRGFPKRIDTVAVTGGPSGGKSSVMAYFSERLSDRGIHGVFPFESARALLKANIFPGKGQGVTFENFQRLITRSQFFWENIVREFAQKIRAPHVVICLDRGLPDNIAYIGRKKFERILREEAGLSIPELWKRYLGAIHLVSCAIGKPEFYKTDDERKETVAQACALDKRTFEAWTGLEHLVAIDNSTDFEEKKKRAFRALCQILGLPIPLEIERKFLVETPERLPRNAQVVEIEQLYLRKEGARIRRRGQNGHWSFYRTEKRPIPRRPRARIEFEWFIEALEYIALAAERNPELAVIQKDRACFNSNYQYFHLDTFRDPRALPAGTSLLEIELTHDNEKVTFPKGVKILKEVTGDPAFTNVGIARRLASLH